MTLRNRQLAALALVLLVAPALGAIVLSTTAGEVKPTTPFTTLKFPAPASSRDPIVPSVIGLSRVWRFVPAVPATPLVPAVPATATTPAVPEIPAVAAAPAIYEVDVAWVRADTILAVVPATGPHAGLGYSIVTLVAPPEDPMFSGYDRQLLVRGDSETLAMAWAVVTGAKRVALTFDDR